MLYIRADGNAEIGTGHIMRCLSTAKAALRLGEACTFITADKNMESLLMEQGFHVICLDSVWNDLDRETNKMVSLISEHQIKKLLVDSYFVTAEYLQKLCDLTYVIYMDDLNAFHYPCHTLINYNVYADKFEYPANYPNTKLLLGPQYAPLREEFQNLPQRVIRDSVKAVMITTGGSDPYNISGKLVKMAKENTRLKSLEFHIAAGRFNANLSMLQDLTKRYSGVIIHKSVQKMSELMLNCDIAVSAGGSTLYELCACGTPTITFAWADNQLDGVATFSENIMLGAGDVRENEEICLARLIASIEQLAEDNLLRQNISVKIRALVGREGSKLPSALQNLDLDKRKINK